MSRYPYRLNDLIIPIGMLVFVVSRSLPLDSDVSTFSRVTIGAILMGFFGWRAWPIAKVEIDSRVTKVDYFLPLRQSVEISNRDVFEYNIARPEVLKTPTIAHARLRQRTART